MRSLEEERAAAQSKATNKEVNLFQVRPRARRTLQRVEGVVFKV